MRHELLHLSVEVPNDDLLLHWAATAHKLLAGELVFYDTTQQVAHETIAFRAGACVGYHESFASGKGGDGAYVCQLTITAPAFELRAGGAPAAVAVATASLKTAADVAASGKAAAAKVGRAAAKAEAAATAAATLAGKSATAIAAAGAAAAAKVILPGGLPGDGSIKKGGAALGDAVGGGRAYTGEHGRQVKASGQWHSLHRTFCYARFTAHKPTWLEIPNSLLESN